MKKQRLISGVSWLFVILLAACSSIPSLDKQHPIQPGEILYADDFSNPKSGWPSWIGDDGSLINYQASGLHILVNESQTDLFALPGIKYTNSRIDVDAVKIGGPDNNHFGIVCRYKDMKNYYGFLITSDRYSGIVKVKNGQFTMLSGPSLEYNEAIRQGETQNNLRAECNNQSLSLWVNNQKSLAVNDSDFVSGESGLTAGSYDTKGVDLYFDNFIVFSP